MGRLLQEKGVELQDSTGQAEQSAQPLQPAAPSQP
jgi:hypothetical protein